MTKNRDARGAEAEAPPKPVGSLLSDYPGAAILLSADGSVIEANTKGASLGLLLDRDAAPGISDLIRRAVDSGELAVGTVVLPGSKGEIIQEVTVVPEAVGDDLLVLARDLTMERNLRSALVESRQRYKDLVEVSSDFAWEVGTEGLFIFVSPGGALGYDADELVGGRPGDFVLDADGYSPLPFVSDRPLDSVELWMCRKDGATACMILSCVPLIAEDGEWRGARGVARDVTRDREREAALTRARNREQLLQYIVSTIRDELEPHNILEAAAAATARALVAAGCRIYRRTEEGAFVKAAEFGNIEGLDELDDLLSGLEEDVLDTQAGTWWILATATHYRQSVNGAIAIWRLHDQGSWGNENQLLIGDVANQLGIANEQIANHERILNLSRTDPMTGLLNRRAFFEVELPRRVARLERTGQKAALYYLDMDNFKMVNDVHGHQRGDDAILFLRDMLMDHSRPGDAIVRMGGDEFAMWLDGMDEDVTIRRAKALLEASKALGEFSGDADHPLGLSIGVALFDPSQGEDLNQLLARADEAMYAVKKAGKGGYRLASTPGAPRPEEKRP